MSILQRKVRLDEVTLMRCILALLIVFMHSFTCYNGGWRAPEGYVNVPVYKWLSRISFACTLEAFVFISGYCFAFQRISLNRSFGLMDLTQSKIKRLYLPSIVFSILYFVIFQRYQGIGNCVYSVFNGCGHLWYLPMLFWCFMGCMLLLKVKCKDVYKVVFLILLNIVPFPNLPLRMNNALNFLLYFYCGYVIYQCRERISYWLNTKKLVCIWMSAMLFFVVFRSMCDFYVTSDSMNLVKKVFNVTMGNILHLIYASAVLGAFYVTTLFYVKNHSLKSITIKLSGCCFGIYIFQQFVLQYLYYKTSFPTLVGPFWLPWCGFIIASVVSLGLTMLLLKTKTGKFLIG